MGFLPRSQVPILCSTSPGHEIVGLGCVRLQVPSPFLLTNEGISFFYFVIWFWFGPNFSFTLRARHNKCMLLHVTHERTIRCFVCVTTIVRHSSNKSVKLFTAQSRSLLNAVSESDVNSICSPVGSLESDSVLEH